MNFEPTKINQVDFNNFLNTYKIVKVEKKRGVKKQKQSRKCPLDLVEMELIILEGLTIDFCPKCFGIWFDFGELQNLLQTDKPSSYLLRKEIDDPCYDQQEKKCPTCYKATFKKSFPSNNLHLDLCKSCGGIWLDGGEFMHLYAEAAESNSECILNEIITNFISFNV